MRIKRFEARNMQEALRQVKEVLGPEAIILSTHTLRSSNRSRPGPPALCEVVAAVDSRPAELAPACPAPVPRPGTRNFPPPGEDPFLTKVRSSGLAAEFLTTLADEIRALRRESGDWHLPEICQGYLRWKIMQFLEVCGPEEKGRKIWAFVGPTGVGKTTTLAKLAAYFRLRLQKKIALITLDTVRIGALDQIKTYARILQVPVEIAPNGEALKRAIARHGQQDLLLIDTAGRNPFNPEQMEELKAALSVDDRLENHLVLSATTKDCDLGEIVERFRALPIGSYLFTKIDETREYASLFNQVWRFKKPLSYLANGQKVPDDLEPATKGRVANLILDSIQWN